MALQPAQGHVRALAQLFRFDDIPLVHGNAYDLRRQLRSGVGIGKACRQKPLRRPGHGRIVARVEHGIGPVFCLRSEHVRSGDGLSRELCHVPAPEGEKAAGSEPYAQRASGAPQLPHERPPRDAVHQRPPAFVVLEREVHVGIGQHGLRVGRPGGQIVADHPEMVDEGFQLRARREA